MIEIKILKIDMESLLREVYEFFKNASNINKHYLGLQISYFNFFNFNPFMEREQKNCTVKHFCRKCNHLHSLQVCNTFLSNPIYQISYFTNGA